MSQIEELHDTQYIKGNGASKSTLHIMCGAWMVTRHDSSILVVLGVGALLWFLCVFDFMVPFFRC